MTANDPACDPRQRTYEQRYAHGKQFRKTTPREGLADYAPPPRDPIAILNESNQGRLTSLIPIRFERMAQSDFAFLRGAADIMAHDLAAQATPGILVQACGDCHLMNFGAFASPENNVLFDINDFDETLPDVDFTVDLRRLATSFAVAARAASYSDKISRRIAQNVAEAYRNHMADLSELSPLEAWHSRVYMNRAAEELFDGKLVEKLRAAVSKARPDKDEDDNFPHIVKDKQTGSWRIAERPPLIYHVETSSDPAAHVDLASVFAACHATLPPEVLALLQRYRLADIAFKVVGVGSVGTFCAIGLFITEDGEPLYLQLKEARRSALERLGRPNWSGLQGARVVSGQRIMQGAADLFLGWAQDQASGRHFYVRHLKNRRLGSITELLEEKALPQYAKLCGRTLARAHARSADPAVVYGYMGKSEAFDDAIASFAMLYAGQNRADFERFVDHAETAR